MMTLELIAVIATLACVVLTMKRHIYSWPIGLVAVAAYSYVFYNTQLYADFVLQMIFIMQGIWGWYMWKKHPAAENKNKIEVERMTFKQKAITFGVIGVMYQVVAAILVDYTDASLPYIDAFVAVSSLVATYWLAKRKLESWYLWILVDAIYIAMFAYKGLALSACLYIVIFIVACQGLSTWKKHIDEEDEYYTEMLVNEKIISK